MVCGSGLNHDEYVLRYAVALPAKDEDDISAVRVKMGVMSDPDDVTGSLGELTSRIAKAVGLSEAELRIVPRDASADLVGAAASISNGGMTGATGIVGAFTVGATANDGAAGATATSSSTGATRGATGTTESISAAVAHIEDAEAIKNDAVRAAETAETAVRMAKTLTEQKEAKRKAEKAELEAEEASSDVRKAKWVALAAKGRGQNATKEHENQIAADANGKSDGSVAWAGLARKAIGCAQRNDDSFTTHEGKMSTTSVRKDGIMPRYLDWLEHCAAAPRSNRTSQPCQHAKREIDVWERAHHQSCAKMLRKWIDTQEIAVPRISMTEQERKHEQSGGLAAARKLQGSEICHASMGDARGECS